MITEQDWIKGQGNCCSEGCDEEAVEADNMDNVFCEDHAEQDKHDFPDNWEFD